MRILLPNLMFEEELTDCASRTTATAKRLAAELSPVMGLLAGPDTSTECVVLVPPDSMPDEVPPLLEHVRFESLKSMASRVTPEQASVDFIPWGWSQQAIHTGQQLQLRFAAPDPAVVALINSRQYSAEFDLCAPVATNHGQGQERFGILCSSQETVIRALARLKDAWSTDKWIIKANFSHAARNRLIGHGATPAPPGQSWLQLRFDKGEVVYVEPWVEPIAECGLQFSVPRAEHASHEPQFDGATEMLTDAVGRYRGSILRDVAEAPWWSPAIVHCTQIANHVQKTGYFGILGMDCMLFPHPADRKPWLRLCHDINGRHTMGRVALSLNRFLQPGEMGLWCHASAKSSAELQNLFNSAESKGVRILQTSPTWIGSQPAGMRTALMISKDGERLAQAAYRILTPSIRGQIPSLFGPEEYLRRHDNNS